MSVVGPLARLLYRGQHRLAAELAFPATTTFAGIPGNEIGWAYNYDVPKLTVTTGDKHGHKHVKVYKE